jgi:hypothetical protein
VIRQWSNERQEWTITLHSLDQLIQSIVAETLDASSDKSRTQIADEILLMILRQQR